MGKRPRDIDGNVIPNSSDLKFKIVKRIQIRKNRRSEAEAKRKSRAAAKEPEAIEQLSEQGLQTCRRCDVTNIPVSAFPVAVESSTKSVDGHGYACCTKCCDGSSESMVERKLRQKGETTYTVERSRMRSLSTKFNTKATLKNKPGFEMKTAVRAGGGACFFMIVVICLYPFLLN